MFTLRNLAALTLAAGVLAACADTGETPLATATANGPSLVVQTWEPSDIAAECADNEFRVFDGDMISGKIIIPAGCTFKVDPADLNADNEVTIYGDATVEPTALIIDQDANIDAQGTATVPVVFTSSKPAGTRESMDWGGVVIIGKANANCEPNCTVEGLALSDAPNYGGDDDSDNSGILKYVRIEFAGYIFDALAGSELNGLSLYSVGSGTTIEYVQVHRGSDDGFEWFGGTVNGRYLLSTANEDDSFDYSFGYTGKLQFLIALQDVTSGDKGIEADNNDAGTSATPVTSPNVCNMTLVGRASSYADSTTINGGNWGIHQRRLVADSIYNAIVVGFDSARVVQNSSPAYINNSIVFGKAFYTTTGAGASITVGNPNLSAPFNRTAPNFRYTIAAPAQSLADCPWAGDGFFVSPETTYRGAASNATSGQWWQGSWIKYPTS